ncbi:hypothetical protein [Prosthecobacter sp.]|uniref:hypothetical protein n=1 Tax=Prosthecobacter sp. TaxID=1965333 RepID=UPI00248A5799|nr:hypothetical protein [Prosthecobacter sp.]MDI1313817.1 hypothetical protein [Prosthecobacter sp.]
MRASRLFSLVFLIGLAGTNGTRGQSGASREAALTGPVVPAVSKELTTESRILYGQAIGEGREVLFKLERAPYWQRLSLAEGTWLPLPPGDLSGCHVAGNKDALFVLNPGLREIRRYNAATLTLEKTARLPDNSMTYHGITAGCLTDDAPLAVMSGLGAVPCDPKELTVDVYPVQHGYFPSPLEDAFDYQASGDGTLVYCRPSGPPGRSRSPTTLRYEYHGPLRGFDRKHASENDQSPTVSASCFFSWGEGILYPGSAKRPHKNLVNHFGNISVTALASSPNLCVITLGDARATPAVPAQCTFYSYYSQAPWATIEVPEVRDVTDRDGPKYAGRLWLDPASLTLAVWHRDQTLTLHTLDKAAVPQPQTPVLLNYPDCYVQRGAAFHFKPQVLGGAAAQVSATDTPPDFTVGADGSMDWQAPQMAAQKEVALRVKLAGGESPCEFNLALQLSGEQPVVAVSATVVEAIDLKNKTKVPSAKKGGSAQAVSEEDEIKNAEDAFASAIKIGFAVPLKSRLYRSDTPIETVLPGLDDYLALKMKDKSLALFSVREWKVAGRFMLGDTSLAFMGGDAVYLYDSLTRLLTRHALPGFALTHRYQLPDSARLVGLAVGETAAGPLTLALQEANRGSLLVLDKQTLTATKWAPHMPAGPLVTTQLLAEMLRKTTPVQIPASSDGRLVLLPGGVLMISAALTMDFSNASRAQSWSGIQLLNERSTAPKIDGLFSAGRGFSLGYSYSNVPMDDKGNVLSHCGSYYTSSKTVDHGTKINFFATDDARLLLRLDCVELLDFPDAQVEGSDRHRQVVPMGEKNLVTVISRGGSTLQVVALDMVAVTRAINPGSAHVTSHPNPIVLEGRTLDYQLAVNNPAGVSGYELRDAIPGASINNLGRFTFRAPAKLEKHMQLNIVIQIRLKSGVTALHKFPIYVLPLPGAMEKTKAR